MNCSLAWELVCYRLETQSIVAIFKTSKMLNSLSKRLQLWSELMNRDFAVYASFLALDYREWLYKELYKYGAYFGIEEYINLYPGKILYAFFHYDLGIGIVTSRDPLTLDTDRVYLRIPTENHVNIVGHISSINGEERDQQIEDLTFAEDNLRDKDCGYSKFQYKNGKYIFVRLSKKNGITFPLKKVDSSLWDLVVDWLHKHFKIERIDVFYFTVKFTGRLLEGNILSTTDPDNIYNDEMSDISKTLSQGIMNYTLTKLKLCCPKNRIGIVELECGEIEVWFDIMNGEKIPFCESNFSESWSGFFI